MRSVHVEPVGPANVTGCSPGFCFEGPPDMDVLSLLADAAADIAPTGDTVSKWGPTATMIFTIVAAAWKVVRPVLKSHLKLIDVATVYFEGADKREGEQVTLLREISTSQKSILDRGGCRYPNPHAPIPPSH